MGGGNTDLWGSELRVPALSRCSGLQIAPRRWHGRSVGRSIARSLEGRVEVGIAGRVEVGIADIAILGGGGSRVCTHWGDLEPPLVPRVSCPAASLP